MRAGLTLPNGIGWSPDGGTMYVVDSMAHVVYHARFDVDDGALGQLVPLFQVENGLPDGLCVADDGTIWLAVWGGFEVQQHTPEGDLLATLPMPVSQPSSCILSQNGALCVTSAQSGLSTAELARQPLAGSVFAAAVGVGPVPIAPFGG
jgi:sugar lactone lactonase YvrE